MVPSRPNIHATALILGDRGLLIRGGSGSGKTTLALGLIRAARLQGRHAALVADDQLFIEAGSGWLLAIAPPTIEGLAEVHGLGPRPLDFRRRARIDLVIDLMADEDAPRLQDGAQAEIGGVYMPCLALAARQTRRAGLAVAAWLGWPPFDV